MVLVRRVGSRRPAAGDVGPRIGPGLVRLLGRGSGQNVDYGTRDQMLSQLAEAVGSVTIAHPIRVAVDGPPGAGKTTLADELADVLRALGREVIRATIEGFLFPRARRYRRGEYSPEGCYFDTHDYDALNRVLLDPLGSGGDGRYQQAIYDRDTDATLSPPRSSAPVDAILIFDGVFLLRPEMIGRRDLRIFVSTSFDTAVDRALIRERGTFAAAEIERRWRTRYIPSQQLYSATVRPTDHADIVVHNDELQQPAWTTRLL